MKKKALNPHHPRKSTRSDEAMGFNRNGRVIFDDLDTRIDRDGIWYYHGSPIGRKEQLCLISAMLTLDEAVRGRMEARISRPVYYELIGLGVAEADDNEKVHGVQGGMERRSLFPDREIVGAVDREWLIRRFAVDGGIEHEDRSLSPVRGDHDLDPGTRPEGPLTPAAVLIPVIDRAGGLTVLLTRRTGHLANHAGQISFPGGHVEADDGSPEGAALRETEEEIGLSRDRVRILGRLDDYITRTGFRVTPVVALVEPRFELSPDPHEVDEVFEVPLSFFLDPANHKRYSRAFEGRDRHFYAMPYGKHYIWGATAGMLINLFEFLTRR